MALAAVLRHLLRRDPPLTGQPPRVSILKPVHGQDSFFAGAIQSHTRIDYPDYELLFGVGDPHDQAVPVVSAVTGAKLIVRDFDRPNAKAASLIAMSREATGDIWVVNDGDIRVTPDYLRGVVAPLLADPSAGVVTCLYRAVAEDFPGRWEALGIATEFAPSTLVAPLVGINEFGLGSTLCFRAADLRQAGGFEPISSYLADDYQLARRLTRGLGKKSWMSRMVVDTHVGYSSWRGVWRHQVRWARTIRVSRGDGYLGLPITYAALWALLALLAGQPGLALAVVAARIVMGFVAGAVLIRLQDAWMLPLIPLWDLWAFAVWIAGLRGNTIEWRGRRMRLHPDGRLSPHY
ncbi:MAG: glycosyltransferase [Bryobacterales bacterium]|nr:glycosyltransferase [Bryobacterales bacterium]